MPAKRRTAVPNEVAAKVLFESDRTCCVCRERGKRVQIHHVNGDPGDHRPDNLAVLCFDCHDLTLLKGGFGRSLAPEQVIEYRDDWPKRVVDRRHKADELAAHAMVVSVEEARPGRASLEATTAGTARHTDARSRAGVSDDLAEFLAMLPDVKRGVFAAAQKKWDTGVTGEMLEGSYGVIDALEGILVQLAQFYLDKHFGGVEAREFMSRVTATRFEWHRAHLEPGGPGSGGTIIGTIASSDVINDLDQMIKDMVRSLCQERWPSDIEFERWRAEWDQAE